MCLPTQFVMRCIQRFPSKNDRFQFLPKFLWKCVILRRYQRLVMYQISKYLRMWMQICSESYLLTIGKKGTVKGWNELGKGSHVGEEEFYFFCWCLRRRSLRDTVWSLKIYELRNRNILKGFDGAFRTSCAQNIVLEIRSYTMAEPKFVWRLCFKFLKSEGEVTSFWEGLLDWGVLVRYWEHNRKR